jgi:uncharacterized cupin superfamily protein
MDTRRPKNLTADAAAARVRQIVDRGRTWRRAHTCSMKTFNLFRGATRVDESDPPGFRARSAQLGPMLGAARLGMTVYELPPGQAICPYHFHWGDEEWLIVVAGTPTLRTPEGEAAL